jgi:L-fucose mutarotase
MLKTIPRILSPELLKVLCEMGHGDEIVIGDGNFPAASICKSGPLLVRADGHGAVDLLRAIMQVIPLDTYSDPNFMVMEVLPGDPVKTPIWEEYKAVLKETETAATTHIGTIEKFAFYERARKAYAVVASGETALYANIIIKKGVIS